MTSKFHLYSACIVAEDKEEDSQTIECFPIENMSYIDGDLAHIEEINVQNTDINLNEDSISLKRRVTIKATWLALGNSNRITSPNVKKGEEVLVYRYANTDEFFWVTIYNELDLRRKEKVIHYYGNTDNFMEMLTNENTYWTKIDTINKNIHLHTSDNDGELTTYDIDIDTKAGIMSIIDGKGNEIILNSDKDTLTANINKEINLNTKDVNIKASNNINISAGNNITTKADNNISEDASNSISVKAGSSMSIDAPKWTTKTDMTEHKIGMVQYKGGMIKHDEISIDKIHMHTGNLGYNTSVPNN